MFKEVRKRFLLGFPSGVFIGYTITIINSLIAADGQFYPLSPGILKTFETPIIAIIVQFLCTGFIGATFAASSCIFEKDEWSLLKQTIIHFLITSTVMYICAFICNWFKHDVINTLVWFFVFAIYYLIFWLAFWLHYKKQIKDINKNL